ncbi:MAG: TolC family protein, partial [Desulfobacterales bacterium]|nr:TolC family protein [Desulfobacterales bacterium]
MKTRTYFLVVTFVLVLISASFGGEATTLPAEGRQGPSPLTLKQSIGISLQKSPTLQAAQSAIKEAQYRRLGTVSDFLPKATTQYSYTRLDKAPYFGVPPIIPATQIGTQDVYNWTTSVTQPVFTGGGLINNY